MRQSSGQFESGLEWGAVVDDGPEDVHWSACECDDGLAMAFSLASLACVEDAAVVVGEGAEGGLIEHPLGALAAAGGSFEQPHASGLAQLIVIDPRRIELVRTSDWATNCPEYKVTAVQVSPSNGPTEVAGELRPAQRGEPSHPAGRRRVIPAARPVERPAWQRGRWERGVRQVAEETAIALTYNRTTYAVMMATPADLEDFAVGFSLTEGFVERAEEIEEIAIVEAAPGDGIEARMWVAPERAAAMGERRRAMAGPTGCGLCGLDSLAQALRPPPRVAAGLAIAPTEIEAAMAALAPGQALGRATRAAHAAGFWRPGHGLIALREDVGRHNALDKLAGALARAGEDAGAGVVVMTSRVSVELVQKAARMGAGVLVAVSAPTGLALRMAEAAGLTLIAVAREDGFELFTCPERIAAERSEEVAGDAA